MIAAALRPPSASARAVRHLLAPVPGMARKAPRRAEIHRPKRFQGRDAIRRFAPRRGEFMWLNG